LYHIKTYGIIIQKFTDDFDLFKNLTFIETDIEKRQTIAKAAG